MSRTRKACGDVKCNRTLHDEFRHAVASTSECCRGRQHSSVPAPSLRPRLATTHSVLFGGEFLFFYLVWWWRARSGFSKRETDGILVPIQWTKFWQNYFLGKGFAKTSTHSFLNLEFANGKGGVWGGIFHLLLFLFWGNSGRTKNTNTISILCLYHSTIFRP